LQGQRITFSSNTLSVYRNDLSRCAAFFQISEPPACVAENGACRFAAGSYGIEAATYEAEPPTCAAKNGACRFAVGSYGIGVDIDKYARPTYKSSVGMYEMKTISYGIEPISYGMSLL
jgi:hypothetical protein